MNRKWNALRYVLAFTLLAMLLFTVPGVQATATKVGLVPDGGVDDMAFNYMAYQGLQQAETDLGIVGTLYEPASSDEYEALLQDCVDDGNALCISVGFAMGDATQTVANANPGTDFAILDYSYESPPDNLLGIVFDEKQAGYLAGALAGKMTSSNTIGVVGGMQEVPAVVDFVEGYRNGAQCIGSGVNVLRNYTGTFTNPTLGAAVAADMISRGADVIFAAAGPTGNGAILYSAQNDVLSIGVDADQYLSLFGNGTVDGSDMLLTSAMKRLDTAVYETIEDLLGGTFASGTVEYNLDGDGVGLAPYHETDTLIPQAVKDYVNGVKQDIIDGTIDINYPCEPRFHAQIVENNVEGYDWLPGIDVTLTIDDPAEPGVEFTDQKTTTAPEGFVQFDDLSTLTLAPDMVVTMTGGALVKTHTVTDLVVTGVDPDTNTVSGTGTPGAHINVQHCDNTGCSWRRWVEVQPDNSWEADFSVLGLGEDEQQYLDIVPGMVGEAVEPDDDGDHTDYRWSVPCTISGDAGVGGVLLTYDGGTATSDPDGAYEFSVDPGWSGTVTPSKLGYFFTPLSRHYDPVYSDIPNQNYLAKMRSTFTSTAAQDGWVLETAENSNVGGTLNATATTLRLGDDAARRQYRSILSFNTGGLPNTAIITKVTLKVKKQGILGGGNPVTMFQGFKVDIKTGTFGTAALQAADFQTKLGVHSYGPFTPGLVGGWYSLNLTAGKAYINKLATAGGLTQMRLYFKLDDNNNTVANYLSLYSGEVAASSRPQLIVEYYVP